MANRENTILLKRSDVIGKVPLPGDIQLGELALNVADVKLYTSGTTDNDIIQIGWDRISRTGDTVTGDFNFIGDFSVTTISATTYNNLPISGLTEGNNISLINNNGNYSISVTGVTGGGGNNDVGVIYLKDNTIPTPITTINQRQVVEGNIQTGLLFNFIKDPLTNSLKYTGPGGRFHIVATFNFFEGNQNTCGFYVGHNIDDTTPLDPDGDRIGESEIYINSSNPSSQPVGGAIQTVLDLQTDDRVFFIVQNRDAASDITVQFLKFTVTALTAEKGDIGPTGATGPVSPEYLNPVFTVELMGTDYLTDFYAPFNLQIDSVTNLVNSPTTLISVNNSPYTLGNSITAGNLITVSVSTASVINLNTTRL